MAVQDSINSTLSACSQVRGEGPEQVEFREYLASVLTEMLGSARIVAYVDNLIGGEAGRPTGVDAVFLTERAVFRVNVTYAGVTVMLASAADVTAITLSVSHAEAEHRAPFLTGPNVNLELYLSPPLSDSDTDGIGMVPWVWQNALLPRESVWHVVRSWLGAVGGSEHTN